MRKMRGGWPPRIGICSNYFFFERSFEKCSRVSLATTPESAKSATKFGIAIRPLSVSATSHTASIDATEPITTTTTKMS